MKNARYCEAGFTLVEVMITVLIFGLMITVLAPMFTEAQQAWYQTRSQVENESNLRQVLDLISKEIRQADTTGGTVYQSIFISSPSDFRYINSVNSAVYRIYLDGDRIRRQFLGTPFNMLNTPTSEFLTTDEINTTRLQLNEVVTDTGTKSYEISITGEFAGWPGEMSLRSQVTPRVR